MTSEEINDLVEEIQQILTSDTPALEEELMDLAARLDESVAQVTKRLKQVDQLLSKGLRSEAIDLAEREPNLNDLITALDFPEFEAWNELLAQFDISAVKGLPPDLAAELNDAYSASASLENLVNRFRTQALSRATLTARIDTLRRLASKDVDNPAWEKDLLEFERARVAEVKAQLEQAVRNSDLEQLASLDHELASGDWRVTVPAGLKKQAAVAHRSLRRTVSRAEMESICYKLSDSYADFDLPLAKRLRQRFDALRQIVNLAPNDPLLDIAGPALDWVAQEEQKQTSENEYADAVAELEIAIEVHATLPELESLYYKATRHDRSLPSQLAARLADRMETLRTQASRKRFAIVVVSCAAGIFVMTGVFLFVRQIGIRTEINGHVDQITVLLADATKTGVLEPLTGYFQKVDEGRAVVAAAPELQGLKQQMENLQIAEAGRLSQMSELISISESLTSTAKRIDQLGAAAEALKKASDLAKNASEKSQIVTAEASLRSKEAELHNVIDTAFGEDLAALTQQVAKLPADSVDGYNEISAQLSELFARPGVSPELKTSVESLQVKVTQQRSMISRNLETARNLASITDAVGRLAEFETRLRETAKTSIGTQRAQDFERVLNEEQKFYRGALAWNEVRQKFLAFDPRLLRASEAQLLLDEARQFEQSSGPYAGPTQIDQRLVVLKAIAARNTGPDGSMLDAIRSIFAARTISSAYQVKTRDGEVYYTPEIPQAAGSIYKFDYFTTITGTQTNSKTLGVQKVMQSDQPTEADWLSPQTKLWRRLMAQLNSDAPPDFEADVVRLAEQVVADNETDAILRFLLLERLLKLGSENSEFFRGRAEKPLKLIDDAGVSRLTNWVVFGDRRAEKDRSNAEFFFKARTDEIIQSLQMITTDRSLLHDSPIGPPVQWVGWLHRDPDGKWVVSISADVKKFGGKTLYCFAAASSQSPPEILEIADAPAAVTSKVRVENVNPTWPEGRPVFCLMETN